MAGSNKTTNAAKGDPARARVFNRLIFGIALFGTLLTVHLWIQSERGFSRGCLGLSEPEEAGIVECAAVTQSDAGKLFGISNIAYGFFFFGAIAALSFGAVLAREERAKQLKLAGFIVSTIGICYALYLFSYQVFVLGQFCQLCLATAFTTAVLFAVFLIYRANPAVPAFDLAGLVREIGWFLFMTLVSALLLVGDVFFVNRIGTLESASAETPVVQQEDIDPFASQTVDAVPADSATLAAELERMCRYDDTLPRISDFDALLAGSPSMGNGEGGVRIVEFFDPNCPHCKTLHEVMPRIMQTVGDRATLHYKPFPLWPFSFQQIEALYLAEEAGLFNEMLDLQMQRQKQGGLSVGDLTDIAEIIGMDGRQFRRDLNGGKYRSKVNRERSQVSRAGVSSVPKIAIEGRFISSRSVMPACFDYFVDQVSAG